MGQATSSRPGGAQQKPGVVQLGGVVQGKAALMDLRTSVVHVHLQEPAGFKVIAKRYSCLSVGAGCGGHVPAQVRRGAACKVAEGAPLATMVSVTPMDWKADVHPDVQRCFL
jgi:hypothetical protein